MKKGITIDVLRTSGSDCSNDGVSKNNNSLWVEVEGGYISEEEAIERGYPIMEFGTIKFGGKIFIHLKPKNRKSGSIMMGGNYATTSDSRFGEAVEKICGYRHNAIAIHDRVEAW